MCADTGIFIVMEWVEGENLEQKILQSSFGRTKRKKIFKQLVEAVIYLFKIIS
jgi:serine/threonine protein kinase